MNAEFDAGRPPIIADKDHAAPSVFAPGALIREARRQKGLPEATVPATCVLDPDGDILRRLRRTGGARRLPSWACYHTRLFEFELAGQRLGIVGCAVGAPFAVLVAEQLFACGCRLLISLSSAGRIIEAGWPPGLAVPDLVLIERALRDEGTSYHYLPPAEYAVADPELLRRAEQAVAAAGLTVRRGASWTTDAPFRETAAAIAAARRRGILAVEMEAAALYAFAAARRQSVLCLAHVTNTMGAAEGDFEKGEAEGAAAALTLLGALTEGLAMAPPTGLYAATAMPDADWWQALWPEPEAVVAAFGIAPDAETVIDLCCGDGLFTLPLARRARRVVAIDLDPALIERTRARLAAAGAENCTPIAGDAAKVAALAPGPADAVLIANTFHGVPDKLELARAVAGVLRPGGHFIVLNWHARPRETTNVLGQPRGPRTELRMAPEEVVAAVTPAGFALAKIIDLPPYHYAAVFRLLDPLRPD